MSYINCMLQPIIFIFLFILGKYCEVDIDECIQNLKICNHGVCVNIPGSYQCYCRPGKDVLQHHNYFRKQLLFVTYVCIMMHLIQAIRATTASKISTSACPRRASTGAHATTWKITMSVPVWMVSKVCMVWSIIIAIILLAYRARCRCDCLIVISGKDCSVNIDECESNPCAQGSTCVDGINSYACVCQDGLTGTNCEIDIDDCEVTIFFLLHYFLLFTDNIFRFR